MDSNHQMTPPLVNNTTDKMDPEIKAEWIAALRSGKYKQGKGALRNRNDEFCCLGVLCDIAANKNIGSWSGVNGVDEDNEDEDLGILFNTKKGSSGAFLPDEVKYWAKMKSIGGRSTSSTTINRKGILGTDFSFIKGHYYELTTLNDLGFTFNEIADIIEKDM